MLTRTDLFQNRRNHIIVDHGLICRRREDSIKVVCLVAQCVGSHGELQRMPFHPLRREHNSTVLAHLSLVPAPASNHHVYISLLFILIEIALLALGSCLRRCYRDDGFRW